MEDKRQQLKLIQESLKLTSIDLKAEAIARELVENGLSLEEIFFIPDGIFKRGYENDVSKIQEFGVSDGDPLLSLQINREGLFDTLPQGIFYQPPPYDAAELSQNELEAKRTQSSKEMKEAMEEAKLFFRPFDNLNFQILTHLEMIEHEAFSNMISIKSKICDLLFPEWENILSKKQKSQLFSIILNAHRMVGNLSYLAKELSVLLETTVMVKEIDDSTLKSKQDYFNKLGIGKLGVDSFLYVKEIANIGCIKIEIGPLPHYAIVGYSTNKPSWQLVNFVAELLLPLEINWIISTSVLKQRIGFELSRFNQTSILGVTTLL